MKKTFLILELFTSIFSVNIYAQKTGTLTVGSTIKGIVPGYDHGCRTDVYIDGELKGSTAEQV